jgi:hypothetical protein
MERYFAQLSDGTVLPQALDNLMRYPGEGAI